LSYAAFLALQFGAPFPIVGISGSFNLLRFSLCPIDYLLGLSLGFTGYFGYPPLGNAELTVYQHPPEEKGSYAASYYPDNEAEENADVC
jgi:hypothetical protein